jgi:hypothetical protein
MKENEAIEKYIVGYFLKCSPENTRMVKRRMIGCEGHE